MVAKAKAKPKPQAKAKAKAKADAQAKAEAAADARRWRGDVQGNGQRSLGLFPRSRGRPWAGPARLTPWFLPGGDGAGLEPDGAGLETPAGQSPTGTPLLRLAGCAGGGAVVVHIFGSYCARGRVYWWRCSSGACLWILLCSWQGVLVVVQ